MNNFIEISVSKKIESEAKRIRAERDKKYGNIYIERKTDMRWVGEIGEICFNQWASKNIELEVKWLTKNVSGQEDFQIGDWTIGLKTVKRKVPPRPSYTAQITAKHAEEPVDYFFFTSYEFRTRILWLLGGIDKYSFLEKAVYYGPGEQVHKFYTIRPGHEIYNIEIKELLPPFTWVRKLVS